MSDLPAEDALSAPERSPDNTPIPGGGRWIWDDAAATWVPNPDPSPPSDQT